MQSIKNNVYKFVREEDGATMVEYVLLVALIGVIAIGAMKFLGSSAGNKLNKVAGNVTSSN
ncbi:MAG: Flp family type IVb pilin [Capsulimonas sp.]|uniref:Flp family type IVb pilin n=1 Tax=Capsulimonas sp. TaxID=2494211 RepID=UPI003266665F